MKKLIFLSLLAIISCKQKTQITERNGESITTIRAAYSSTMATTLEIYYYQDTFYGYRTTSSRARTDSAGTWISSTEVGTWQQILNTFKLTVPSDSKIRIAIPFNPLLSEYQVNAGDWNYCCDCNSPSKCCMAYPSGNLGYVCIPCTQQPCAACIAVHTDLGYTGGYYLFYDSRLNGGNFKLVN